MVTQTSQFAVLKRVLWFMEHRQKDYSDDKMFPHNSYAILKRYIDDCEKQAAIEFKQELILSEQGIIAHGNNLPAGYTGE